jgi:AraC-like DNA-binding protein
MDTTPRVKSMTAGINGRKGGRAGPSVSAGFARALVELAVSKGADGPALAARAGLDLAQLEDQDNRIAYDDYVTLMRAAKAMTGDDALALHYGEAFELAQLSIVALIGQSCETMADAFAQLARYTRLIIDIEVSDPHGQRLVLSREGGEVWLVDTRTNPNAFPELTESSFARMASASRIPPGQTPWVKAIHVTHAAPAWRAEYDRVFRVPITFESDRNALLMADDSFLTVRTQRPSRYVFGILSERADALLAELQAARTVRGRVESVLLPILHTGKTNMETTAARLGLSRATLFRQLRDEGVTFEKILDDLRHRMALDYLGARKVSVNETAYLVGFSDPTAFSRAFKRWEGRSPREIKGQ